MAPAIRTAELEAAISALPAKKQRLRESFDRLVASAPIPIPFTWDDIDAHISSLQSSIALRFCQLQSLQATPAADPTTTDPVEPRGNEDQEPRVEDHVRDKGQESNEEEREWAERAPSDRKAEEDDERVEEAAPPDREDDEEGEAIKASPPVKEDEEGEAIEASHGHELEEENENAKEAIQGSAYQSNSNGVMKEEANCPIPDIAGGSAEEAVRRDLVAACANMDASTFADMLCWRNRRCLRARRQFLPALLGAAEPHALVIRAVRDFLSRTEPKSEKHWENCAALLHCVHNLTAVPSVDTLKQANRLAEDWKEMIGKPESCRDLGRLAVWGLWRFLVSYNITLEFDANEIIHHLSKIPRNKKKSCIDLCNCLGLIHTMTDSINRLIENGQQLDAVRLACALNLTDKYPPLSIMNEYVDKAKKTAQEILSKESDSPESLNQAMTKQVNALILSWRAVDEYNIDSVHRNSIKAEITQLLHGYAHRRQSLCYASSSTSIPHQQHKLQEQSQQQLQNPEEQHLQHQKLQEKQHQKPQELQLKPDEDQHHHQEKVQEAPEQEWGRQKLGEKQQNRKRKRNEHRQQQRRAQEMRQHRFHEQPRLSHAGSCAHSPYNAGPGIRNHPTQQFSEIRGAPPRYPDPCNGTQPRPA